MLLGRWVVSRCVKPRAAHARSEIYQAPNTVWDRISRTPRFLFFDICVRWKDPKIESSKSKYLQVLIFEIITNKVLKKHTHETLCTFPLHHYYSLSLQHLSQQPLRLCQSKLLASPLQEPHSPSKTHLTPPPPPLLSSPPPIPTSTTSSREITLKSQKHLMDTSTRNSITSLENSLLQELSKNVMCICLSIRIQR